MTEPLYTNLGVIEDVEKPTHFKLDELGSTTPIPETYHTIYSGEIYHQRKLPACGAHAGAYLKNLQENRIHSPAYLWKRIKQIDGFPPDAGTSMEGIFKALQKHGVCSLKMLKNNTNLSLKDYTDASVLTAEMDDDALRSRIGAYAFKWNPTIEDIKRAIYDHKVVLMRVEISADWWTPSWNGKDILPLKTNFPGQGGHFVVVTGYDKESIYGLNEWGLTWGDKGEFYFNKNYMGRVTYIGTCFDFTEEKTPYIFKRTLKKGDTGSDVGALQVILKDRGYMPLTAKIDSMFGPITENAVKALQKAKMLVVDGIFGPKTQAIINDHHM